MFGGSMLRTSLSILILSIAITAFGVSKLQYPETKKVDQKDVYHGTEVVDPYRWLETDVRESQDVAKWVEAENKVSYAYLETLPGRQEIEKKLTEMWNYARYSVQFKQGGRYFFTKHSGLQNQSVLYTTKSFDQTPQVLLDPNTWSKDGTVALSGYSVSDD